MKRFLAVVILIISLLSGIYFGVYKYSNDNIENMMNGYTDQYYSAQTDLTLENWTSSDGENYVSSTNDPTISFSVGTKTYVKNVRLDGKSDISEGTMIQIFYTDSLDEEFTEEKSILVPLVKKNSDIYFSVNKEVSRLRLDIFDQPGKECRIYGVEINPNRFNIDITSTICAFGIPLLVLSVIMLLVVNRKNLKGYFADIKKYRFLIGNLVSRDVKTKYRRSALGILWSVLNPLLMMMVLTAVFSNIFRAGIKDFPVYYLSGYVIFNFVSEATTFSLNSILGAKSLIKKVYIPKYIFPLEKCIFSLVNTMFTFIAALIMFMILGVTPSWTMLLFFVPILYSFVFSFGLGLVLAAMNVFFRDIGHLYHVLTTAWMYLTPIIYPVSILPDWLIDIIKLNPLYYYVQYFRSIMLYGTVPGLQENLICIVFAGLMLILGILVFKKKQDKFILYI